MSCRKAGPDSSGILSLSNSCLRPPGQGGGRFGSELARLAVSFPRPLKCPQVDAILFLCWALQRLSEPYRAPFPPTTLCAKDKSTPLTEEDTEARVGDALPVATQGYLPPQCDRALSTKLCHFPGSKRSHWKMQLKSQRPLLTTWQCPTLSGKSSMHAT